MILSGKYFDFPLSDCVYFRELLAFTHFVLKNHVNIDTGIKNN